jgi:uncharacterized protein
MINKFFSLLSIKMKPEPISMETKKPANGATPKARLFDIQEVIHELKHYLPAQAPLKDFIHHNTLHAFQALDFQKAIDRAAGIFGYNVSISLKDYRALFDEGKIREDIIERVISLRQGPEHIRSWKQKMISTEYRKHTLPRIGAIRAWWKKSYRIDLDSLVHPTLFRIICSYLDQGIAIWNFPVWHKGFLASIRELERNSFTSFFRTDRARKLLMEERVDLKHLLATVVGDESLYKQYLFDQQFSHQGWSGLVSAVEDHPQTLLDHKKISLVEVIIFELLLEIDSLDYQFGTTWAPLGTAIGETPPELFADVVPTEISEVLFLWQEAYEWTYYDEVIASIRKCPEEDTGPAGLSFQAMFCIDDRECSLRRYIEKFDPACQTYGTPGFFNVEFYFKPEHGKFYTKLCPAPMTPRFLIKATGAHQQARDIHFTKHSHTLFRGWLISQTFGFWAALRLFLNIFKPSLGPATATSFQHMDKGSKLTIENKNPGQRENDLQVGFTVIEMVDRVEGLLKSIGVTEHFAQIVYILGHGSSSVNNPHYAAYDCGACSGRPGSVNARVICYMANHPQVRAVLKSRGIMIPQETQFLGGLHDTTRDEIVFYDEECLTRGNMPLHKKNLDTFHLALLHNAKERSRRFDSIHTAGTPAEVHEQVKVRSVSLFEPRPELNHATNSLCIVGRRSLTRNLFLDRRAFLNSYDYRIDLEGEFLLKILSAAVPVCGGINLEYFFSRVDNQKLGAGTKLPHNVMGLFGVANGIEGDLRPGLPNQMVEVHDPIRLLMIIEHFPDVVLSTILRDPLTYEWFAHGWIHLVVIDPQTKDASVFREGKFCRYDPLRSYVKVLRDFTPLIEKEKTNLPVFLMN